LRRHLRTESNESAQARRDAAYAEYRSNLEHAWRNPPGVTPPQPAHIAPGPQGTVEAVGKADPRARAAAIEREAEKWRHGA
jgi:hypothetical protein